MFDWGGGGDVFCIQQEIQKIKSIILIVELLLFRFQHTTTQEISQPSGFGSGISMSSAKAQQTIEDQSVLVSPVSRLGGITATKPREGGRESKRERERERSHHDMRGNPNTVYRKSCVEFERPSRLQGFQGTI